MERKRPAGRGISADFSRTCEGCSYITAETVAGLPPLFRCGSPGPRKGYTVSTAGRFLPYVPAWCPLLGTGKERTVKRQ